MVNAYGLSVCSSTQAKRAAELHQSHTQLDERYKMVPQGSHPACTLVGTIWLDYGVSNILRPGCAVRESNIS